MKLFARGGVQTDVSMRQRVKRWTVAELVPLILLGLVGATILLAAPIAPSSWTTDPPKRQPRISPAKPLPTNKFKLALVLSAEAQPTGDVLTAERATRCAIALAS